MLVGPHPLPPPALLSPTPPPPPPPVETRAARVRRESLQKQLQLQHQQQQQLQQQVAGETCCKPSPSCWTALTCAGQPPAAFTTAVTVHGSGGRRYLFVSRFTWTVSDSRRSSFRNSRAASAPPAPAAQLHGGPAVQRRPGPLLPRCVPNCNLTRHPTAASMPMCDSNRRSCQAQSHTLLGVLPACTYGYHSRDSSVPRLQPGTGSTYWHSAAKAAWHDMYH